MQELVVPFPATKKYTLTCQPRRRKRDKDCQNSLLCRYIKLVSLSLLVFYVYITIYT